MVQITLVGKQTVPVILGIEEMKPDSIILVCSDSTLEQAYHISGLFQGRCELYEINDESPDIIEVYVRRLLNRFLDERVQVNLTGGMKMWALAFASEAAVRDNVETFIINQNNTFYNYRTGRLWDSDIEPSTREFMGWIQAIEPEQMISITDFTERDEAVYRHLIEFTNGLSDSKWKEFIKITNAQDDSSQRYWDPENECLVLDLGGEAHTTFSSEHARNIVQNAGWFEYEVAKIISHWRYATDVWLGIEFYQGEEALNEIDIIVNTGWKLLFIECKSGLFRPIDIDKFNTAVRNYGGNGSKSLLVARRPISPLAKTKCIQSGTLYFSFDGLDGQEIEKELFPYLEANLFRSNI